MDAINITSARKDLYNLVAGVNASHRPVTITSKTGNAVLISDEDWKDIEETLYPVSYTHLDVYKRQVEKSFSSMAFSAAPLMSFTSWSAASLAVCVPVWMLVTMAAICLLYTSRCV